MTLWRESWIRHGIGLPMGIGTHSANFPSDFNFPVVIFLQDYPIFQSAQLAEHYDMAIVAAEGYANEAVRTLFEHADQDRQYQLFVLHDADPDGYNICRTLREATERMPDYSVDVIDLGLHLEEGLSLGLDTEEFTRKKALPDGLVLTETEREYFEGEEVWRDESTGKRSWKCQRLELNAFTAPELIDYVKRQLQQADVRGKVIPPDEVIGQRARLVYEQKLDALVDRVVRETIPLDQIKRAVAAQFREHMPWQDMRD
jgi:hypothetical protein